MDTTDLSGVHSIIVVADPDDLVEETNETNNVLSLNINITTPELILDQILNDVAPLGTMIDGTGLNWGQKSRLHANLDGALSAAEKSVWFYNRGKTPNGVHFSNLAMDRILFFLETLEMQREKGWLDWDDYDNLVKGGGSVSKLIAELSSAMINTPVAENLMLAEQTMLDIKVLGYLNEPGNDWWDMLDARLTQILFCYQEAAYKLSTGADCTPLLDSAETLTTGLKDDVEEYASLDRIAPSFAEEVIILLGGNRALFPPDLGLHDGDFSVTGDLIKGHPQTLSLDIQNTGMVSARNIPVQIEIWAQERGETTREVLSKPPTTMIGTILSDISREGEDTVELEWTPANSGTYMIRATIDPLDQFPDADRDDNILVTGVYVIGGTEFWNGGRIIDEPLWRNDTEIWVDGGDVVITGTGSLILDNTTLVVKLKNEGPDIPGSVFVNGTLELNNGSTLTADTRAHGVGVDV
ncbi:MAG: hypothetical protein KAT70_07565, partial [Thermoplasmata archaeon]|nr:hypothetical protein [Thermoplasmata archaeon]